MDSLRHSRGGRVFAIVVFVVLAMGLFGGKRVSGDQPDAQTVATPHHHADMAMESPVITPMTDDDGTLTIAIPHGTDAAMKISGDAAYHMPSVIRLAVGDTVVIRNDDDVPHMMLYAFLMPGEVSRRVFSTVGSEAYSSGCAANAAAFHDFTTIFITQPH